MTSLTQLSRVCFLDGWLPDTGGKACSQVVGLQGRRLWHRPCNPDHMRHRVLVVDDDPDVRRAYERHLSSVGYEVCGASSLREGRARLASVAYDAVILDLCLGQEGALGLELAADVARQREPRPFLVLTAYGEPIFGRAAARLRADVFLHKPVSLAWLDDLLRKGIAGRQRAFPARVHAS